MSPSRVLILHASTFDYHPPIKLPLRCLLLLQGLNSAVNLPLLRISTLNLARPRPSYIDAWAFVHSPILDRLRSFFSKKSQRTNFPQHGALLVVCLELLFLKHGHYICLPLHPPHQNTQVSRTLVQTHAAFRHPHSFDKSCLNFSHLYSFFPETSKSNFNKSVISAP